MKGTVLERVREVGYDYESADKELVTTCNLCGSRNWTEIARRDRYGFGACAQFCNDCALAFLSPRLTAAAYMAFYKDSYRPLVSAFHGRRIDAETVQEEQKPYARALSSFLSNRIASLRRGQLLDIGGSTGVVSARLAEDFGFTPFVLDPSPQELEVAAHRGCRTQCGLLEQFQSKESFDLVLLCQTVDHLLDIKDALRKIKNVMSPDGMFFVDILDFRAVYLNTASLETAIKIDHPFYLVPETMAFYLSWVGFQVTAKAVAADKMHVGFLCCHAERPDQPAHPDMKEAARFYFREIREVQARCI